jgi:hypothetical protein
MTLLLRLFRSNLNLVSQQSLIKFHLIAFLASSEDAEILFTPQFGPRAKKRNIYKNRKRILSSSRCTVHIVQ